MASEMLAAALALVGRGWPVFPCVPDGKAPLGRFVPNGFHGATLDPELVSRWWTVEPNANVAMPTGSKTRDVLDVDVKHGAPGYRTLNRLKAAGLLPEPIAIRETPSGGLHLDYVGTDQPCSLLRRLGVDFKASGGYVLVPPSVVDGKPYKVIRENPARHQLNWSSVRAFLDPPKPVTHRAVNPGTRGTGIPKLAAYLATKTKPGRNAALFWAACRAVENGATESDLHDLYSSMQFGDGFDERQAARTVADAYRTISRRSA